MDESIKKITVNISKINSKLSSVITQKREYQNGCYKKTKHAKISEKLTIITPWYAHAHVRISG